VTFDLALTIVGLFFAVVLIVSLIVIILIIKK
jgi:hypothetical protein